jgi:uncharacterized protein YciI
MFIVLLGFSKNKDQAGKFMDGYKAWITRGFDDGVFLLSGSIQPSSGGAVLVHNTSYFDLDSRVYGDPFVAENIVGEKSWKSCQCKPVSSSHFSLIFNSKAGSL